MKRLFGRPFAVLVAGLFVVSVCPAGVTTLSGYLSDPANTALIGSDAWVGNVPPAAQFADDDAIANNVALFFFTYASSTSVRFTSSGYSAGGGDPYFTLLSGGDGAATFFDSNYSQAFSTGGDFDRTFTLGPGSYVLALGVFANMSFAENGGIGSLSDGFIRFGTASSLGTDHPGYYEVAVTTSGEVPEPATFLITAICGSVVALKAAAGRRKRTYGAST